MINIFDVTLERFVIEDGKAVPAEGLKPLGKIKAEQLLEILEVFRNVDLTQTFEDDPNIIIQTRDGKYSVRTLQRRLMLYNLKKWDEPALVLEAKEMLAEVDGSAPEARMARIQTRAPFAEAQPVAEDTLAYVPPPREVVPFPWKLFAAAVITVACTLFILISSERSQFPGPDSIHDDKTEILKLRESTAGVYLTGDTPGHHGLVIHPDGSMKLFRINRLVPPSMLYGTYEFAYQKGKLCLTTQQSGCLIMVKDQDTLLYCEEIYRRAH